MKKTVLLFVGLILHLISYSQIASLYAGLSGIVAKKSEVDVELLTQIIVDKQQQIKKEFARKTILNHVNNGSYAFSSFANQSFDILFNTTNKIVASRKLIESSANLALSYGFTEFYLQASKKLLKNDDLAKVFMEADSTLVSLAEKQKWLLYLSATSNTTNGISTLWDNQVIPHINPHGVLETHLKRLETQGEKNAVISKESIDSLVVMISDKQTYEEILIRSPKVLGFVYNQYNKMMPGYHANIYYLDKLKPVNAAKSGYSLNALLIDLVFDVMLNTEQIAGLGFYASENGSNQKEYQLLNKYISYINTYPASPLTGALKTLHKRVSAEVNLLFKTYTLIQDISQKDLSIAQMLKLYEPYQNKTSLQQACNQILGLQNMLANFNTNVKGSFNIDSLVTETNELFYRLKQILVSVNNITDSAQNGNLIYSNNDLLYITRNAYQIVTKLSFLLNNVDQKYFMALDTIYHGLLYANISYLNKFLIQQNPALAYQKITAFSDFVSLLTNLNDLDKASSYEAILNIIQNAGAIYGSSEQAKAINSFVNNIEKYTTINTKTNTIYVDVESIILAIYNKYANQDDHRLDFYFSLGLNQSISLGSGFKNIALDTLNSFGYAVEKIGVKVKIINIKGMRAYQVGEKAPIILGFKREIKDLKVRSREPIVSDIHAIVFGSGLLYNIVNTKTSEQFSSYLLGTGLGMSFYNGLDAHVCINYPLGVDAPFQEIFNPSKKLYMFSFSLDIKIGEYLAALSKKSNTNK